MHFILLSTTFLLAFTASAFTITPRDEPSNPVTDLDLTDDYSTLLAHNLITALALHQQQAGEDDDDLSTLSVRDIPDSQDVEIDEDLLEALLNDDDIVAALADRSLPPDSPAHGLIARDPGFLDSVKEKARKAGKAIGDFVEDTKDLLRDAKDGLIGKCNVVSCGSALGPATVACLKAAAKRGTSLVADLSCLDKV